MITIDDSLQAQQLRLRQGSKASWEDAASEVPFSLDIVEGCERFARPKHCFTPQMGNTYHRDILLPG